MARTLDLPQPYVVQLSGQEGVPHVSDPRPQKRRPHTWCPYRDRTPAAEEVPMTHPDLPATCLTKRFTTALG